MLLSLLTAGAACALGAFIFSLKLGDRGRIQRAGALFVAMLAMLLSGLYPQWSGVFGAIALVAAFAYAVPAVRSIRRQNKKRGRKGDE